MWPLLVLFSMMAASGAFLLREEAAAQESVLARDANLATNMAVYRSLVIEFARGHPSARGAVPDAALHFPPWYARHPAWRNEVLADGTIVVYGDPPLPATLAIEVAHAAHGSIFAGQARRRPTGETFLYSPTYGDTGMALPPLQPGSPVWLARLD